MPGDPRHGAGSRGADEDLSPLARLIEQLDLDAPAPRHRARTRVPVAALVVVAVVVLGAIGAYGFTVERGPVAPAVGTGGGASTTGAPRPGSADDPTPSGIARYRTAGWIAAENAKPGTKDWTIADDPKAWDKIRGFADRTSVNWGDGFGLHVQSGAPWRVDAYRIGYYGGQGGRLVWSSDPQPAVSQPPAVIDKATGMREAPWSKVLDVRTDEAWPPGMYLLKLVSDDGGNTYVPLVVRDDGSTADLLVQSSVTTWQAYNGWGGANLYTGPGGGAGRSRVVSFDRPYGGNGSGEFLGREYEFVFFAESLGLDLTYWTDIDLHTRPQRVRQHRGFVSLGHDEYYSNEMRAALEAARDGGVNLAFLGANAMFRKIRLEDSPLGPARREVNYRSAKEDPTTDPQQETVSWRDAPSNKPESALLGNYYECNPVQGDMVIAQADSWVFAGTGWADGTVLPGLVGNEYDRVTPEAPTPANVMVLAHSPVTCKGRQTFADISYYTAPSGAGVLVLGTFRWIPLLDDACPDGVGTGVSCQVQQAVGNVLREFAKGPSGLRQPSKSNLDRFGIRPGYLAKGWPAGTRTPGPPAKAGATTTAPPDGEND